jgi:hypothetical protein
MPRIAANADTMISVAGRIRTASGKTVHSNVGSSQSPIARKKS